MATDLEWGGSSGSPGEEGKGGGASEKARAGLSENEAALRNQRERERQRKKEKAAAGVAGGNATGEKKVKSDPEVQQMAAQNGEKAEEKDDGMRYLRDDGARGAEDDVAEWIQEYLQARGYGNTLKCFQAELLRKKFTLEATAASQIQTGNNGISVEKESLSASAVAGSDTLRQSKGGRESLILRTRREALASILAAFDIGDSDSFEKLWRSNIPLQLRKDDLELAKLYFLSRVYFLARASVAERLSESSAERTLSTEKELEWRRFKLFLENEGGKLAGKIPSLEKFPALLYIKDPHLHPSFKEIFGIPRSGESLNSWASNLRGDLAEAVDDILQHVPAPRLLQMYDAFMTSYAGFSEQLKSRRKAVRRSRGLAKRLFSLSVKLARDLENADFSPDKTYKSTVRRELQNCREEMQVVSKIVAGTSGSVTVVSEGGATPDFLMGEPPALSHQRIKEAITGSDPSLATDVLDALWWRTAKAEPPGLGGLVDVARRKKLRFELRSKLSHNLSDGDVLGIRSPLPGRNAGFVICQLATCSEGHLAAALRVIDCLVGYKAGRDYFMLVEGAAAGLSKVVERLEKSRLSKCSSIQWRIASRHVFSALQRLSVEDQFCVEVCAVPGFPDLVCEALKHDLHAALRNEKEKCLRGRIRFEAALLLRLVTRGIDSLSPRLSDDSVNAITDSLCQLMTFATRKSQNTQGSCFNPSRWGRHYASAALYDILRTSAFRDACKDDVAEKTKALMLKVAAVSLNFQPSHVCALIMHQSRMIFVN